MHWFASFDKQRKNRSFPLLCRWAGLQDWKQNIERIFAYAILGWTSSALCCHINSPASLLHFLSDLPKKPLLNYWGARSTKKYLAFFFFSLFFSPYPLECTVQLVYWYFCLRRSSDHGTVRVVFINSTGSHNSQSMQGEFGKTKKIFRNFQNFKLSRKRYFRCSANWHNRCIWTGIVCVSWK